MGTCADTGAAQNLTVPTDCDAWNDVDSETGVCKYTECCVDPGMRFDTAGVLLVHRAVVRRTGWPTLSSIVGPRELLLAPRTFYGTFISRRVVRPRDASSTQQSQGLHLQQHAV